MNKLLAVVIGCLLCCCYVFAALKIKEIVGPEYIEDGSTDELVLDCDFEAKNESDIVLKWFLNGQVEQIYQWITDTRTANAIGPLKDIIDPTYNVTDNSSTMLRALKFTEVSPAISGNYTCKVSGDYSEALMTKQVIVYSPATSFQIALVSGSGGDEAVFCDALNVTPKPIFHLYIAGGNESSEWLDEFSTKTEVVDEFGYYNISITLPFNSSYLEEGTTRFVCNITIPGTNYSEVKSVEHVIDSDEPAEYEMISSGENYSFALNFTEENRFDFRENGLAPLKCSLLTILMSIFPLLLTT